jgi:hypothetical protein
MRHTKRSLIEALEALDVDDDTIVVRADSIRYEDVYEVRTEVLVETLKGPESPQIQTVVID